MMMPARRDDGKRHQLGGAGWARTLLVAAAAAAEARERARRTGRYGTGLREGDREGVAGSRERARRRGGRGARAGEPMASESARVLLQLDRLLGPRRVRDPAGVPVRGGAQAAE